jgi:hypothetical protein
VIAIRFLPILGIAAKGRFGAFLPVAVACDERLLWVGFATWPEKGF